MTGQEFVDQLNEDLWRLLAVRDVALAGLAESVSRPDMPVLLRGALRAEMEAAEIAALWMPETPEVDARLAFARQSGDEARHYMLIADRLRELGADPTNPDPLAGGHGRLFEYLRSLSTTVTRVAAAQFTREAIGWKSNELFIAFCEAAGDTATAEMYRTSIQPDERHHHEWGRRLLAQLAPDGESQEAARGAVLRTLELAEELRSLAAGRLLVEALPGC
jgi:hypothetical protein